MAVPAPCSSVHTPVYGTEGRGPAHGGSPWIVSVHFLISWKTLGWQSSGTWTLTSLFLEPKSSPPRFSLTPEFRCPLVAAMSDSTLLLDSAAAAPKSRLRARERKRKPEEEEGAVAAPEDYPCLHPGCQYVGSSKRHLKDHARAHRADRARTVTWPSEEINKPKNGSIKSRRHFINVKEGNWETWGEVQEWYWKRCNSPGIICMRWMDVVIGGTMDVIWLDVDQYYIRPAPSNPSSLNWTLLPPSLQDSSQHDNTTWWNCKLWKGLYTFNPYKSCPTTESAKRCIKKVPETPGWLTNDSGRNRQVEVNIVILGCISLVLWILYFQTELDDCWSDNTLLMQDIKESVNKRQAGERSSMLYVIRYRHKGIYRRTYICLW